MKRLSRVMELTAAYRLWQAPFAEQKLAPIRRQGDLARARRVLDVGCGPGTNTRHFAGAEYLGVDLDEGYVVDARRRHGREFVAADVVTWEPPPGPAFDFILVNSFFHHIDTEGTRRILARLARLLTPDGHVHILDLVLPDARGVPRTLAQWDRGDHPRPLHVWRGLFRESFEEVAFEPYPLTAFGVTLWQMVYFKGRSR